MQNERCLVARFTFSTLRGKEGEKGSLSCLAASFFFFFVQLMLEWGQRGEMLHVWEGSTGKLSSLGQQGSKQGIAEFAVQTPFAK